MSEDFELIGGTGNVFRDLGREDADAEQLKALLAAQIMACLDRRHLTVRAAAEATGSQRPTFHESGVPSSIASRSIASWASSIDPGNRSTSP